MTSTVMITGGGGALGRALVRHFSEKGWSVCAVVRSRTNVFEDDNVHVVESDIATEHGFASVVGALPEPPALLVHAAAIYRPRGGDLTSDDFDSFFRTNAISPYRISRSMLQQLQPDRGISIVCVNSEAMFHADAESGVYGASKAAFRVLTTALSAEAKGTKSSVSTVTLGPLKTPTIAKELEAIAEKHGQDEKQIAKLLLGRSNPSLVIEDFISLTSCCELIEHVYSMGHVANGANFRLDGGSAGSLI